MEEQVAETIVFFCTSRIRAEVDLQPAFHFVYLCVDSQGLLAGCPGPRAHGKGQSVPDVLWVLLGARGLGVVTEGWRPVWGCLLSAQGSRCSERDYGFCTVYCVSQVLASRKFEGVGLAFPNVIHTF